MAVATADKAGKPDAKHNIEAVREAVRRALRKLGPPRPSARARLSVDRVFSVKGAGTVVKAGGSYQLFATRYV